MAFGIPLLAILIFAGATIVKGNSTDSADKQHPGNATSETETLEVEGYVDQSGLISIMPPGIPPGHLLAYADEEQARQALESGDIAAYYVILEDFVETGEIFYVYPDTTPLISDGQDWLMRRTLLVNLLDGDIELADRVWDPMDLEVTNLAPEPQQDRGLGYQSNLLIRYLPAIMAILFYVFLLTASNILLRNISSEKENQTIEILMLSLTPPADAGGQDHRIGNSQLAPDHLLGRHSLYLDEHGRRHARPAGGVHAPRFYPGLGIGVLYARLCHICQSDGGRGGAGAQAKGGQPGIFCGYDTVDDRLHSWPPVVDSRGSPRSDPNRIEPVPTDHPNRDDDALDGG